MKTQFKGYLQVSCITLLTLPLLILTFTGKTESQDAAKMYQIDAVHSSVLFRAKHKGVTYFYGRFNEFSGNIKMDETDISKSNGEFRVKTSSVDTANEKRDQHLRSPDLFNAKQFPVMTFNSTKVSAKPGQENALEVVGDFEMHGVKKSITVDIEITGKGKAQQGGELVGFETTFGIKRSEYGMTYGMQGISDEVRIIVSVEAALQ